MRSLLSAVTFSGALALGAVPAGATTYNLSVGGFTDGATFTGQFKADDMDGNGQISSFNGEVSDFHGSFSGNGFVGPLSFTYADLFGLVYDLDGFIDNGYDLAVEGIGVANDSGEFLLGPGPFAACDGGDPCGLVSDFYDFDLTAEPAVITAASVPEPATWAMLMLGFGLVGAAYRRTVRMSSERRASGVLA